MHAIRTFTYMCSTSDKRLHLDVNCVGINHSDPVQFTQFKDTCYGLGKISQNQQLLDILACNPANRPSKTCLSDFLKMVY